MRIIIFFMLAGCTTLSPEEREYRYQEQLVEFRQYVAECQRQGRRIVVHQPVGQYRDGIANADRPLGIDMKNARC